MFGPGFVSHIEAARSFGVNRMGAFRAPRITRLQSATAKSSPLNHDKDASCDKQSYPACTKMV